MRLKDIFVYWAFIFVVASLFSSCNYEEIDDAAGIGDGDMVYFGMNLPDAENIEVTRAAATDIEKVIYTVRVLAFDGSGVCFYNEQIYDGYNDKKAYQTSQALGIPKQTGDNYKNSTIWVVANVGKQTGVSDGSFDFSNVTEIADMNEMYGYLVLQEKMLRDCLPMTGSATVDMTVPTSVGSPVAITMERVLAKVSFTVNVNNSDLEFYFNNWSVESLPRFTYVVPQNSDLTTKPADAPSEFGLYYPANSSEKDFVTYKVGNWLQNLSENTFGFYMYENRKGGRLDTPDINNLYGDSDGYADEIKSMTDASGTNPNFKTFYAPADASFLIISGLIRNTVTKDVTSFTYKIALGANNYNDYNIKRNHNYVYNININGVTHDDVTVDVDAFDSRVHKDYALQITAPASEKMDAHYDKRYIEITASTGQLDLQFYKTLEDAQNNFNPITTKDWIALSDMDTYNIDIDEDESTAKTYNMSSDLEHLRLYVYARENVSTSSRTAVLKITHTPPSDNSGIVVNPVSRYYTYTQAGLIEVNGLYVESYEEYGMDIDPSSDELTSAQGLQWGWALIKSGNSVTKAYDFTSNNTSNNGLQNTKNIIASENDGNAFDGVDINSLYNNYAARYCYNKNKRDIDGNIIEEKWYLPSIDELIPLTADGVSNNWSVNILNKGYWSSSVPTKNETTGMPDDFFWGQWAWDTFVGDYLKDGSEYEYRNVAKSSLDGDEDKHEVKFKDKLGWIEYTANVFYPRITKKYVRAVRVKD